MVIAAGFYFLIYRPQQRKAKAAREQVKAFDVGDEVLTAGGIVGHIIDIDGDRVTLETSVGASFVVLRQYVLRKLEPAVPESTRTTTTRTRTTRTTTTTSTTTRTTPSDEAPTTSRRRRREAPTTERRADGSATERADRPRPTADGGAQTADDGDDTDGPDGPPTI